MGCPGALAQYLRARSGQKRTSLLISREKGDHYYVQTQHNDLFSHYNLFLGKLKENLARKARVNTERVPLIPLKSNLFNMATVSVKRCIPLYSFVYM